MAMCLLEYGCFIVVFLFTFFFFFCFLQLLPPYVMRSAVPPLVVTGCPGGFKRGGRSTCQQVSMKKH